MGHIPAESNVNTLLSPISRTEWMLFCDDQTSQVRRLRWPIFTAGLIAQRKYSSTTFEWNCGIQFQLLNTMHVLHILIVTPTKYRCQNKHNTFQWSWSIHSAISHQLLHSKILSEPIFSHLEISPFDLNRIYSAAYLYTMVL